MKYLINSDEFGRIELIELTENRKTKDLRSKDNRVFISSLCSKAEVYPGKHLSFIIDDKTTAHQIYEILRSYKRHMASCILNNIAGAQDELFESHTKVDI